MQEGDLYSQFNKANKNKFKDILELLESHRQHFRWFKEEVVLDVGCGPGDLTRNVLYPWLPENSKRTVLGVDVSPVMKDIGNKKYNHPDVLFETLDVSSKNLDVILDNEKFTNGFTKIFSFHVFHWINDLETAFTNLYKLLKPQGQVLLTFPYSRQYQRVYKQMQDKEPWATILKGQEREIPGYFLNGDAKTEFMSIVLQAGFKVITCECITTHDEFASLDVLKKLIGSLDIHINKIPIDLQAQYLEECADILRQRNLKELEDGRVISTEKRIVAFLEK